MEALSSGANQSALRLGAVRGEQDLARLFELINDADLVRFSARYKPVDFKSHAEWFDALRRDASTVFFGIFLGDELIGSCGLYGIDLVSKTAELRARIDLAYTSKGYGSRALGKLISYGFGALDLQKIYLYVFDFNTRAARLYERLGFVREGLLRRHAFIDGELRDLAIMSLFR